MEITTVINQIKQLADGLFPTLQSFRHHLHQHPELSFQEFKTAAYIKGQLESAGFENIQEIGKTGLTLTIEGNGDGPVLALRADIDALPIMETEGRPYGSQNAGVMHACGHDVHSACVLGALLILNELRKQWPGKIKVIFQPGEEKAPGGASVLIREGILENPKVDAIIGQHVMPLLPVGTVGFRPGRYMASADEIYMTIHGKGGHGAMPHKSTDTVLAMAHIITALQQVVSRRADPAIPSVLSFGRVQAGGATNILPNEVEVDGTFRTMDEKWREEALQIIAQTARDVGSAMGVEAAVKYIRGYPVLHNNPEITLLARDAAVNYLGAENVVNLDIWMASEDFAFYSQMVPGCFYRLGTRNEAKGITALVHTPDFDIDEEALKVGAGLLAYVAFSYLWKNNS